MFAKFIDYLKKDTWAWVLLTFGFFLRLFYIFLFTTPEQYLRLDDGYDQRALQIAEGKWLAFSTYFPPFTHLVLSLIYRPLIYLGIINWRTKIDIVIFALLYMLGFWCIYQITKKLFSEKIALTVLVILIFWYPFIFLNYVIQSENLFFPFVFLGLYILITKHQNPLNGLLIGTFWGIAFITRPIFALIFPLFFFWALFYKINWKFLGTLIIAVSIVTGSMMLFNFYYTHGAEKSISSNGGVCFAMIWCDAKSIQFNNNNGYNYWFAPPGNDNYPDSKRVFTDQSFENQGYYYKMGFDCLKKHPQRLFENLSSTMKLFNSSLIPIPGNVWGWEAFRFIFKFLTDVLFLTSCLTIISIFFKWIKINENLKKYFYLFALIILSLLATVYLQNVGEERYIIPFAPLLMILSLPFILSIKKRAYMFLPLVFIALIFIASPQSTNFYSLPFPSFTWIFFSILISLIFLYIAKKKPIGKSHFLTIIFLAGLLLRIAYLSDTPADIRGHDLAGHVDYVKYVSIHKSLPAPDSCWQCYQPPLYYVLASPICKITSCNGPNLIWLQILSLVFNAVFLYLGIKLLRLLIPKKIGDKYFYLASTLFIFWPSGIIGSVAVGNDSLLWLLTAGGLYFIALWFNEGKLKNLWIALVFLIAAILTKSNGIILLGIISAAIMIRTILNLKSKSKKALSLLKTISFIFLIFFICFSAILFLRPSLDKSINIKDSLVANANLLGPGLAVGDNLNNFIVFDVKEFLRNPYTDPWNNPGGRQYFSNYLLKTSLFGEFNFWQQILKNLAKILSYLLLLLLIIIVFGMIKLLKKNNELPATQILIVPSILLFLGAIIFNRYLYSYSCSADFRYIYPIVIFLSATASYALFFTEEASRIGPQNNANYLLLLSKFIQIIILAFIFFSISFFVIMIIL